jgi:hypothetical protein
MIRLFRLAVSLVLLLVLLVVADRLAASVAASVVAGRIQASQHLAAKPKVEVRGFPFLTQLIKGRYTEVDATATDLRRGDVRATSVSLHLYGVRLSAGDVLTKAVKAIPVERADGSLMLTVADLNALAHKEGVTVASSADGTLTVTGSVTVAGHTVKGSGRASVAAVSGGIKVTVSDVTTPGLPSAVASLLKTKLAFTIPTDDLPFGITVQSAATTPQGVQVDASAGAFTIPVS